MTENDARNRDERGQCVETLSPEDVLAFCRDVDEPLTATEVADEFGVTNRTAQRLPSVLCVLGLLSPFSSPA